MTILPKPNSRRTWQLALTSAALAAGLANAATASTVVPGNIVIELQPVSSGLTLPISIVNAGDGSDRLFVVEKRGLVHIVDSGGVLPVPFLDVAHLLTGSPGGSDERGLLGIAFHPNYAANGRLFARYSAARPGNSDENCFFSSSGCHREVVAEFAVTANPDIADPTPTIVFEADQPESNHNGGHLAFGPDGLLYFALGDGGGANDGISSNPPAHGPIGHGQNVDTPMGAMLRIDVDNGAFGAPYGIPSSNPFVGQGGLDEIYAYGFRNPYRFSFDRADGRLFVGDVGQSAWEEVSIVENGGNYGWVYFEGAHCFALGCPSAGPMGEPLVGPIAEYSHSFGISVIGGYVYRGALSPVLTGKYVFGDFSQFFFPASGRLFYLDSTAAPPIQIFEFDLDGAGSLGQYVLGFGEDEAGEIYVAMSSSLSSSLSGNVYRIVAVADSDNDGVQDVVDNCTLLANPDQLDTNGDQIGNACDPDLNDDCIVNFADLAALKAVFLPNPADPDADFTGDGLVNFGDLARLKQLFFTSPTPGPGPSAAGCR